MNAIKRNKSMTDFEADAIINRAMIKALAMPECDNVRHDKEILPLVDNNPAYKQKKYAKDNEVKVNRVSRHAMSYFMLTADKDCKDFMLKISHLKLADGSSYLARAVSCAIVFMSKYDDWSFERALYSACYAVKRIRHNARYAIGYADCFDMLENQQVETRHKQGKVYLTDSMVGHYEVNESLVNHDNEVKMSQAIDHVIEVLSTWYSNLRVDAQKRVRKEVITAKGYNNFMAYFDNCDKSVTQFYANIQRSKAFGNLRYNEIAYIIVTYFDYIAI
jgi:hypothetical protein